MDVKTVSEVITDIYELLDKQFSHSKVARGVKLAVDNLNIYSKSQAGFVSDIVVIGSNLTAQLPKDCGSVYNAAKVFNGAYYILDRDNLIPTSEGIKAKRQALKKCSNCTCGINECEVEAEIVSLPSQEGSTTCPYSTFYNPLFCSEAYLCGTYRTSHAKYNINEGDNTIEFSGLSVGDEVLVGYVKTTNASKYQLIPLAAFDVIFYKAQTYFNPANTNNHTLYQRAKYQFDGLKERENYTLDGISRSLKR